MSLARLQWSAKRMKGTSTNASSKHTRLLFGTGSLCGLTDRQLLNLFLARHGNGGGADAEVAFAWPDQVSMPMPGGVSSPLASRLPEPIDSPIIHYDRKTMSPMKRKRISWLAMN